MDWNAAADAVIKVWRGGGIELCIALLVGIAMWRKPWFRDREK